MRRFILLAMAAGLTLVPFARPALAATKTPFTATISLVTIVDPGSERFNGDVYHLRDQQVEGTLTGDLEGSYTQEVNVNYNNHDLRGNAWGTLVLITPDVTWVCTYRVIVEDLISGTFVGRGDDGSEISGTWTQVFGEIPATLDGTILGP